MRIMYLLKTDKDKEYEVSIVSPVFDGSLTIMLVDERTLSEIAPEFEGIHHMEYFDGTEQKAEYNGYTVLASILRTNINNMVQILLRKPTGGD